MYSRPSKIERRPRPIAAGLLILALALLFSGCYTLLRHPSSHGDSYAQGSGQGCSQCHSESEEAMVEYAPWVNYYAHSSWPWINYYGSPWWQDEAWVLGPDDPDASGDAGSGEGTGPSGRQAWARQPRGSAFLGIDSTRVRNPLIVPAPLISAPPSPGPAVGSSQGQTGSASDADTEKPEDKGKKEEPRKRSIRR